MVIGITGNTGAGKSLVAGFFEEWDGFVIAADCIGWEVLQNQYVVKKLKETFGEEIISGGEVDRKRLGEIVFKDSEKLEELNKIVHPILLGMLKEAIDKSAHNIVVIDAALIFEWGIEDWFDYIILVDSKPKVLRARLKRLGISDEIIKGRLNSQMNLRKARKYADFIVENNGSVKELRKSARRVWEKILEEKG